jgi:hypothetical protein
MSRAGARPLQRSGCEIVRDVVELGDVKHTRNNGEAAVHLMSVTVPHNVPHQRRAANDSRYALYPTRVRCMR